MAKNEREQMKYTFPHIETIDDVLKHIEGNEEFIVIDKGDYKVIDYILQNTHTFPFPYDDRKDIAEFNGEYRDLNISKVIKRECRGLIFDKEGKLISRPFHKFFNYGEKTEEQTDLDLPEYVCEKLDGSMIRPLVIDGDIRLATRKGITDVAMQAEEFAAGKDNYINFISGMVNGGYTPIFEWCSRKNQIVIDYPEDNLILLAIRNTKTGEYMSYDALVKVTEAMQIPVVRKQILTPGVNAQQIAELGKSLKDEEGFVMVWPNGHRMKAKAEWYTTLHKAKEAVGREKDLIKAYLTTGVDDILPILPENYKQEVAAFLSKLTEQIFITCKKLDTVFMHIVQKMPESFTRKQFALEVIKLHPKYKHFMFALLPGTPCIEVVVPALLKACSNNKLLDENRWLIGGIRFRDKLTLEAA